MTSVYNFNLPITKDKEKESFSRGKSHACFHTLLLVVVTCVVAIFNERSDAKELGIISMSKWSITPMPCSAEETHCIPSLNNVFINDSLPCILNSNHAHYFYTSYGEQGAGSLCNLLGKTPLFEREGTDLFSVINIPFLILSSQVLKATFSLLYIREDSIENTHDTTTNVQKTLKKVSLFLLITYAVTFLFMQNSWKIPGNNMFIVEIFFLFAIFLIAFLPSSYFSENATRQNMSLRFLEFSLTIPLIAVGVLAVSGNTFINDALVVFFCLLFANAFLLLLEIYKSTVASRAMGDVGVVILTNAWLCLVPFVIYCAISITKLRVEEDKNMYATWVMVSIAFLLTYELLFCLSITLYNGMLHTERLTLTSKDMFTWLYFFLDFISVFCSITMELCILCGALLMVIPKEKTVPMHHRLL
jgi:hypothetical protein